MTYPPSPSPTRAFPYSYPPTPVRCGCVQVEEMMAEDGFAFVPMVDDDAAVAAAAALTVPVVPASDVERALCSVSSDGERLVGPGNGANAAYGSGGFLDFVFRYAALELYGVDVGSGPLSFERGRNADFEHVTLQVRALPVCASTVLATPRD